MIQKLIAESIGIFAMMFFGCGAAMLGLPETPIIFGMVVATMVYAIGHISGAHFNPAVTLAFAVTRHFPVKNVIPYIFAQCVGAMLAIAALYYLIPEAQHAQFGATIPTVSAGIAFVWEVLLSFFLMFVITAVATDTRAEGMMAGVAIGSIVALAAYVGGAFSGTSMNPARSLAPALFAGHVQNLWIYLTAPFIGAMLGAFTYQRIRCENTHPQPNSCC